MRIGLEIEGMTELVKALEECASDSEIQSINKKIIERAEPIIKSEMAKQMPKSRDISQSGRGFGSKSSVSQHAADAIPVGKIRLKDTGAEADVGWTKSDNSENFYVKFINWGTIHRPPQEFIFKAGRNAEGQILSIAEQEYQAFLNRTVG